MGKKKLKDQEYQRDAYLAGYGDMSGVGFMDFPDERLEKLYGGKEAQAQEDAELAKELGHEKAGA